MSSRINATGDNRHPSSRYSAFTTASRSCPKEFSDDENIVDNPFGGDNEPVVAELNNDWRWEQGFKFELPEFHGGQTAEELLDWIVTVKEVLEFKHVPLDRCIPIIAMKFCGHAAAWWTQLKAKRVRLGKRKIMAWDKLKNKLRKKFLPYNYDQIMFQRLQNLRQGSRSVEDYSTEFVLLLTRVAHHDSDQQIVVRFIGGL